MARDRYSTLIMIIIQEELHDSFKKNYFSSLQLLTHACDLVIDSKLYFLLYVSVYIVLM